jgi:hypothetical protein
MFAGGMMVGNFNLFTIDEITLRISDRKPPLLQSDPGQRTGKKKLFSHSTFIQRKFYARRTGVYSKYGNDGPHWSPSPGKLQGHTAD